MNCRALTSTTCAWASLALITIMMIVWQLCGAPYLDDLIFRVIPQPYFLDYFTGDCKEIDSVGDAAQACGIHYMYTTSRLSNMLMIFSNLIPEWLTRTLHGLMLGATFLLTAIAIGGRGALRAYGFTATLWLLMWVLLPMWDCMIASDYMFNYAWPSVPFLIYIYCFYTPRFRHGWPRVLPLAAGLLTGMMHEGAGAPLLCATIAAVIVDRADRRWRLTMAAPLALGTAISLLTPVTMFRISTSFYIPGDSYTPWVFLRNMTFDLIVFALPFVALAIAIVSRKLTARRWLRDNTFLLTAIAACVAIFMVAHITGRAMWFLYLLEFILIGRTLWQGFDFTHRPGIALGVMSTLLLCAVIGDTARRQLPYSQAFNEIVATERPGGEPVIFHDLPSNHMEPWWTFNATQSVHTIEQTWMLSTYTRKRICILPILPDSLRDLKVEQWPKIPGNTGLSGQYPMLAGRRRLNDGLLTITFGKPQSGAAPLYTLLSGSQDTVTHVYSVYEHSTIYQGDTLWYYIVGPIRRIDMNRPILSIDITEHD